jgi:Protein of unknown function (DUF4019)
MFEDWSCSQIALALALCGCARSPKIPPPNQTPSASAEPASNPHVAAATRAALVWLGSIDQESYLESWDAAAETFRQAVSRGDWANSVARARRPLGVLVSRQVQSAEYKTSLPGAPDGTYVVIEFRTSFEKKAHAVETVTPMLEDDGTWKVSGYFIR